MTALWPSEPRARTSSTRATSSRRRSSCLRFRPTRSATAARRSASALARPLIAKHLVNMAAIEGATVVAHAGLPHGLPSARLTTAARAIDPAITVVDGSGVRANGWPGMVEYAKQRGIPIPPAGELVRSTDANVWGRTLAGGVLDDFSPRGAGGVLYASTKRAGRRSRAPAYVEIEFDRGVPVAINGVPMPLAELIQSLDTIAGAHGIGRLDVIEERSPSVQIAQDPRGAGGRGPPRRARELQRLVTPHRRRSPDLALALEYAAIGARGRLVFVEARGDGCAHRACAAGRHGHDSAEASQGPLRGRGTMGRAKGGGQRC